MWNRKYVKLQGIAKHRSSTGSESWILGICIIMEELPTGNLWALPIVSVPQKASQGAYETAGAGKPGSMMVMDVLKHPWPGGHAPASLNGQELSGGTTNYSGLGVVSGPAGRNTAAVFLKQMDTCIRTGNSQMMWGRSVQPWSTSIWCIHSLPTDGK